MKKINRFFLFSVIILIVSLIFSAFITAEQLVEQSEQGTSQIVAVQPIEAPQGGPPLLPMTVIGIESKVNGKVCSSETIIEAVIGGKVRTKRNCDITGRYTVAITGTADDAGKDILFFVDGILLPKKETWASGKIINDFSFDITRELTEKEKQKIAEEEQIKKQLELEMQQKEKQQKIITGIVVAILLICIFFIVYYVIRKQTKQKVYKQLDNKKSKQQNNNQVNNTIKSRKKKK